MGTDVFEPYAGINNLSRYACVIKINNTQSRYAQALDIIYQIENSQISVGKLRAFIKNGICDIFWLEVPKPMEPKSLIEKAVITERTEPEINGRLELLVQNCQSHKGRYLYLFVVQLETQIGDNKYEETENVDIVNLQYLLTAWQPYAGKLFLYLNNDSEDRALVRSGYHKLSQYLYLASRYGCAKNARFYDAVFACYYDNSGAKRIQRLQINSVPVDSLKKFVPILFIDKESRTIFSKSLKDVRHEYNKKSSPTTQQSILWSICCGYLKQSQDDILQEILDEGRPQQYDDMSILSFYIYCVFRFFTYEDRCQSGQQETLAQRQKLISDVQDYASGIKELVDNVVRHSDSKSGYLGIRIHSKNKLTGLTQRCFGYFQDDVRDEYYLELCITDSYSPTQQSETAPDCIMVHKFLENLRKRKDKEYCKDLTTIQNFEKKFQSASLRDFFAPKHNKTNENRFCIEDWDKFYSITANVLHHYGLMRFTSIVESRRGFFKVRSGRSFQDNADCRYSTVAEGTERNGEDYYVPGTQYTIVLPISLKAEQYTTGFGAPSSELEFTKLVKLGQVDHPEMERVGAELKPQYLEAGDDAMYKASRCAYDVLKKWFDGDWKKHAEKPEVDPVFSFNWASFNEDLREAFLKGLFYYIDETKERTVPLRIAIYNCSFAALLQCSELFLAFYNRYSEQEAMRLVDIYLVEKDCRDDFLISGENLRRAAALSEHTAFAKGRFTLLHAIFSTKIWTRYDDADANNAAGESGLIRYIPYDLLIKVDEKETVFEKAVKLTLQSDIQEQDFGCCVTGSHVRVGSKIHVTENFYEAQELFNTPHYLQRFGYLIALNIHRSLQDKRQYGDVILVGYETYSELLVITVEKFLNDMLQADEKWPSNKRVLERIIFENGESRDQAVLRESQWDHASLSKNTNVVLIVPINSTLSTHSKVWAKLKAQRRFAEVEAPAYNMAVILIRAGAGETMETIEGEFWSGINLRRKVIDTNLISPHVNYLISVATTWWDPLKCEKCYPPISKLVDETPIIDTNKASVIPTQMIGLRSGDDAAPPTRGRFKYHMDDNESRICVENLIGTSEDATTNALTYGHIACNGNHFQFFFNTETLLENIMRRPDARADLEKWLERVREALSPTRDQNTPKAVYDILVIPEHKRNAAWVDEVIKKVFYSEPYVLRFNVSKEFRDNVKAKCSNISTLYHNLKNANKEAEIRFHFVDCTIASGRTFRRAETLMRSLFPSDAFFGEQRVKVRLFESIILILNRTSLDTQNTYIKDGGFFAYITLHIPQMRNHDDACVLCNLEKQSLTLSKRAATNEVAKRWMEKAKKHRVVHDDELERSENEFILRYQRKDDLSSQEKNDFEQERIRRKSDAELSFRRLSCAQTVYREINSMGVQRNYADAVENKIWFILEEMLKERPRKFDQAEYLISYIKVLSRPFLTFRKSILEASFHVRLELLTTLLTGQKPIPESNGMGRFMSVVSWLSKETKNSKINQEKYKMLLALLKALGGSLSKNNSNYMIRKVSYAKIFDFFKSTCLPLLPDDKKIHQEQKKEFEAWYINTVKRLIESSGDETKCLWLEKLLLTGSEWQDDDVDEAFTREYGYDGSFGQKLYLENTRILFDGIRDLHIDLPEERIKFLNSEKAPPYFLRNFTQFVNGDYTGVFQVPKEKQPIFLTKTANAAAEVSAMVDLYSQLNESSLQTFEAEQASSGATGTEEFYKNLTSCMARASGANKVLMFGEVLYSDQYAVVKRILYKLYEENALPTWGEKIKKEFDELVTLKPYHALYEIIPITDAEKPVGSNDTDGKRKEDCIEAFKRTIAWSEEGNDERERSFWLNEDKRIAVLHLQDDRMQPVYFLLDYCQYSNKTREDLRRLMLRGVRNLLTFRHMFVKKFVQDFNNDLMPNYVQAKVNKGRLSIKHGWGHTSDRKLDYQMDHMENPSEIEPEHIFEQVMQAYADQICGHLYLKYVQRMELPLYSYLGNKAETKDGSKKSGKTAAKFVNEAEEMFSFERLKLLHGKKLIEKGDITSRSENILLEFVFSDLESESDSIMVLGKESHIISALFLLANNAMQYAAAQKTDEGYATTHLSIYRDGIYLVISSPMLHESKQTIHEYIDKANARLVSPPVGDDSISLWTIGEYVKDTVVRHEWKKYLGLLLREKNPDIFLKTSKDFLSKLKELEKTCCRIELECENGELKYDQMGYVENANFVVRLPILLEEKPEVKNQMNY